MRIVVLDGHTMNPGDMPWEPLGALGELAIYDRTPPDLTVERCRDAAIAVTNKVVFDGPRMSQLPALRFIAVTATGYNVIDLDAATAHGIVVSNVPVYSTDSVAQLTFAFLLEMCHQVALHDQAVHAGEWTRRPDFCFWKSPQMELAGKRMGIIGMGRIGRRVGEIAHAFGMEVMAASRTMTDPPGYAGFRWGTTDKVFRESDVVSLHCPLTEQTKGLVCRETLGLMKRTAFLINTGRGPLINEQDLADALRQGVIAGAAVDVVSAEPIQADNPLLACPNCIITPHIAWTSRDARRRLIDITVDNVKAYLAGKPVNVVNRSD